VPCAAVGASGHPSFPFRNPNFAIKPPFSLRPPISGLWSPASRLPPVAPASCRQLHWQFDVGGWRLAVGGWLFDVRCWMLDVRCWLLAFRRWLLDSGSYSPQSAISELPSPIFARENPVADEPSMPCSAAAPHGAGVILQLTVAVPAVASVMTPLIHISLAMMSLGV